MFFASTPESQLSRTEFCASYRNSAATFSHRVFRARRLRSFPRDGLLRTIFGPFALRRSSPYLLREDIRVVHTVLYDTTRLHCNTSSSNPTASTPINIITYFVFSAPAPPSSTTPTSGRQQRHLLKSILSSSRCLLFLLIFRFIRGLPAGRRVCGVPSATLAVRPPCRAAVAMRKPDKACLCTSSNVKLHPVTHCLVAQR